MSKRKAISLLTNSNLIDKKGCCINVIWQKIVVIEKYCDDYDDDDDYDDYD